MRIYSKKITSLFTLSKSINLVLAIICIIVFQPFVASAQNAPTPLTLKDPLQPIGPLPKAIPEASGLAITKSGILWTHNDGGVSALYGLDSAGNLVKTVHLNHPNAGWEDLAQDDKGNVYIGGFGNNENVKRDLKIYKIPDPETITDRVFNGEIIHYTYGDQTSFPPSASKKNFDMDAFFSWGDSLYLFTKNRTVPFSGYSKIYIVPNTPGNYELQPVDSIFVGKDGPTLTHWVTGADISPDKKTIVLLSHDRLWIIKGFTKGKISKGKVYEVRLNHLTHKAGVCFTSDTTLSIVDELEFGMLGGKLYTLDLTSILGEIK